MDLKYFKNQGNDTFEINIKGILGVTVDGDDIAAEIKFLNEIGAKVIIERINSIGGGLINGLSIISANLASTAEIHTFNDGMAGSIAGVILATGTPGKRFGFDFSTAVIHNPSFDGDSLEDIQDEKIKEETQKLKDSIVQIFANNTKMSKSQASRMMNEDKMLNAKEQIEIGLIDEIVTSKMKPVLTKNMSYSEIMNVCDDKESFKEENKQDESHNNNQITKKMSNLTKFYNLSDDATEASILEEAQKDRGNLKLIKNKVETLEGLGVEKDTEISNLKKEVEKYRNEAIAASVEGAIKAGKYTEDKKEELIKNATAIGLDAFNVFTESIPVKPVNVIDQIQNTTGAGGYDKKTKDQKLFDEYQNLAENDKIELKRIKDEEPARFEKMFNAWNK